MENTETMKPWKLIFEPWKENSILIIIRMNYSTVDNLLNQKWRLQMQTKSISVKYYKTQMAKGVNSGEILWNFNQSKGWDFNYQQYKKKNAY